MSSLQKLAVVFGAVLVLASAYYFSQSRAGTMVGLVSVEPGFVCGTSTVSDADGNVYNTVQIGQQCWMKQSMRVGTRIASTTAATNNGSIEKYCYSDIDTNCTDNNPNYPDGGMYLWNEAMEYSTAEGARGICPIGFHIPTDQDWHLLENYLTPPGVVCDPTRTGIGCFDAALKLLPNGTSGFEANRGGRFQSWTPSFSNRGAGGYYWSSTAGGSGAWTRRLDGSGSSRTIQDAAMGLSVRCIKDAPTSDVNDTLDSNPNLERGLVGHWTFDGPDVDWSSTTAEIRDVSGSNNHGNATSSMTMTSSPTLGVLGQGVRFDGVYDKVTMGNIGSDRGTFAVWLKPSFTYNPGNCALGKTILDSTGAGHSLYVGYDACSISGRNWVANFRGDYGAGIDATTSDYVSEEDFHRWIHLVVTWDKDVGVSMYTDGRLDGFTAGTTNAWTSTAGFVLGDAGGITRYLYEGAMDDVRAYNRVLPADEIKRLYQLGATTKIGQTLDSNTSLKNGLVGHWTFDGTDVDLSSTTAEIRDRSGGNHHGDLRDTLGYALTRGILGQGLLLASSTAATVEHVLIPDHADLSGGTGVDRTWAFWVKPDNLASINSYGNIITKSFGANDKDWFFGIEIYPDSRPYFYYENGAGQDTGACTFTSELQDNVWSHVMVTYDGDTRNIWCYFNGALEGQGTLNYALPDTTANITIGTQDYTKTNWYTGGIDDFRIYNRTLSAEEVKRVYQLGT